MQGLEIYDDAAMYDLAAPPNEKAVTFYIGEARRLGGPVLELACGTGSYALKLAESGLDVTGLDIHPGMLARARDVSAGTNVAVDFVEADMRDFSLPGKFGLIFIARHSLLHLLQAEDLTACFQAVSRHLVPGGKFILEIVNPNPQWLVLPPGERRKIGGFAHPELGEVKIEQTLEYDRASQVSHEIWYWSAPGNPDFRVRPMHLRLIYPEELPLLLQRGGLRLAERYGGYDRRPFDGNSPSQICFCGVGD